MRVALFQKSDKQRSGKMRGGAQLCSLGAKAMDQQSEIDQNNAATAGEEAKNRTEQNFHEIFFGNEPEIRIVDQFKSPTFVALVGLCIVSTIATALGLYELMDVDTSDLSDITRNIVQVVFGTLITVFVILVMVITLARGLLADRLFIRIAFFVAYSFFAFWSATLGYGFFWKNFSSEQYTFAQFETMITQSSSALGTINRNLSNVLEDGQEAARQAQERSQIEEFEGNSCDNTSSLPGPGPLRNSRRQFSADATDLIGSLRSSWTDELLLESKLLEWRVSALRNETVPSDAISILGDQVRSSVPGAVSSNSATTEQDAEDVISNPDSLPEEDVEEAGFAVGRPTISLDLLLETNDLGGGAPSQRALIYRQINEYPSVEKQRLLNELENLADARTLSSRERGDAFDNVYDEVRAFSDYARSKRDVQGPRFITEFNELARQVYSEDEQVRAQDGYCEDEELFSTMINAAATLEGLEDVSVPEFEFVEGPRATQAAFAKLAGVLYRAIAHAPQRIASLVGVTNSTLNQDEAPDPFQTFGQSDFVALLASIAVDFGILVVSIVRTPRPKRLSAAEREHRRFEREQARMEDEHKQNETKIEREISLKQKEFELQSAEFAQKAKQLEEAAKLEAEEARIKSQSEAERLEREAALQAQRDAAKFEEEQRQFQQSIEEKRLKIERERKVLELQREELKIDAERGELELNKRKIAQGVSSQVNEFEREEREAELGRSVKDRDVGRAHAKEIVAWPVVSRLLGSIAQSEEFASRFPDLFVYVEKSCFLIRGKRRAKGSDLTRDVQIREQFWQMLRPVIARVGDDMILPARNRPGLAEHHGFGSFKDLEKEIQETFVSNTGSPFPEKAEIFLVDTDFAELMMETVDPTVSVVDLWPGTPSPTSSEEPKPGRERSKRRPRRKPET
ncbi:MAG: hypothetical protein AAFQ22_12535 [Pseudomonadota bacterium]